MLPLEKDHITNISYDSVIFGFTGEKLKIVVVQYLNTSMYALPGGYIKKRENLADAVQRGVKERTGLDKIHLEQFHTFGQFDRADSEPVKKIAEGLGDKLAEDSWLIDRFITVGFYSLIDYHKVKLRADSFSESLNWYSIDELPPLMMDHQKIVKKAIESLQDNLEKKLVTMKLLPEKFTMKDLQTIYEIILGKKLRRTTFQRKMLSLDVLIRHEKLFTGAANKAPYLYSFDPAKIKY